ncbi:DUF1446 domain-containing protein [Erythrobacter litoralis]|uniref:acyclic terpene utilization AtuA family protein n=1 Tax=Erythrobacter litoralis TaxID=39960 RepID=UPI002435EADF|nr:DUF1446 domain-containing protein [Erythrobacter litoralis]MDG6079834.1 DUF1446 domain-containing protein [Erythrobacter litoralis]
MTDNPASKPPREDVVRIGAASASFVDSRIAMSQLLGCENPLDYIVFDCLAEGVMSILARARIAGEPGYVSDFVTGQIAPYLDVIAEKGVKVIANAGGLDPRACAAAVEAVIARTGIQLTVASISGDNLGHRVDELVNRGTCDMFSGADLGDKLQDADQFLSLSAYTGAFPIARALAEGADIVITGRVVDSATALGALIHEFGWSQGDFDLLSAGTLAGHLIECTTQVTGATFTDWDEVRDWANIGFPIAACHADGMFEIGKPEGSGGIVSVGTVSEQLLYEVGDASAYAVPDVVCDWTGVEVALVGPDRVRVSGAKGRGRPNRLKAALTWDRGWRATALAPIVGQKACAKANRTAAELFKRCSMLLAEADLPGFQHTHCDVIGDDSRAICRMVADHIDREGAALFAREQSSIMTSMCVGTSVPLGTTVKPLTFFGSFLLERVEVPIIISIGGHDVHFEESIGLCPSDQADPVGEPAPPDDDPVSEVPLIALAWARSGDKGDLFNVGVIARKPTFLPHIYHALSPDRVAAHYAYKLGGSVCEVTRKAVPGIHALNLVVSNSLSGGMLANPSFDPAAKGMAQLLLDFPVPIPSGLEPNRTQES